MLSGIICAARPSAITAPAVAQQSAQNWTGNGGDGQVIIVVTWYE